MAVGGVVLVAAVFGFALPRLASYRDVLDALSALSWPEIAALVVAVVINLATFAPPWMAALPGLGFLQALTMTQASQAAASTLPGGEALGVALSVGMLRGWGFPAGSIAVAAVLVSVWNTALKVAFPLLALALLARAGSARRRSRSPAPPGSPHCSRAAAGTAVIWSDRQAHRVGEAVGRALSWLRRRIRRPPVTGTGDRFVRFRNAAIGVLRRRWHVLTLATLVGNLAVFAVLLVCLRSLGVSSAR